MYDRSFPLEYCMAGGFVDNSSVSFSLFLMSPAHFYNRPSRSDAVEDIPIAYKMSWSFASSLRRVSQSSSLFTKSVPPNIVPLSETGPIKSPFLLLTFDPSDIRGHNTIALSVSPIL
jgi:hypothetical protein